MKGTLLFKTLWMLSIWIIVLELFIPSNSDCMVHTEQIICFGDSVTEGVDTSSSYVELLSIKGFNVVAKGKSGHYFLKGLKRFESEVLNPCPDSVIIMFGLNDLRRNLQESEGALIAMIKLAKENHVTPFVCTPTPHLKQTEALLKIVVMIRNVCLNYGATLIDLNLGFENNSNYMATDEHPNEKGHQLIAQIIEKFLIKNGEFNFEAQQR